MEYKFHRFFVIVFLCCILLIPCLGYGEKQTAQHHYYDRHGNSLEKYDHIWEKLYEYYGSHLPNLITINYIDGNSSLFHPPNNSISIAVRHLNSMPVNTIAHETSHLALSFWTKGASLLERFRFFDEGFASIIGAHAAGTLKEYKRRALNKAAIRYQNRNVSFEKVQQWSSYYGKPDARDWTAYDVGASFIFFILDTYGRDTLFKFFTDIGKTRDLAKTVQNLFNQSLKEFEARWLYYLSKIETDSGDSGTGQLWALYPLFTGV